MNKTTASENGAEDRSLGPLRVGDVVAEKYVVERTLGVGGMGVVVQARDQVLDRPVAIKFLLPKLTGSETAVQRFVREARAATRITSEHVVRLLEIEKLPTGTPFFVMEYLDGCDLRTLIREQGALPATLAVDYVLQALQAVAEGHVRGIVHRDIKPGNLFLTRRADGTPLIKVLDFGIAKTAEGDAAESTSLTSSDDVRLGSPAYMPPEQLQNPRDVDLRSDIWSLGATLYELICGRPPFEGAGYLDLATHVLNRPPAPFAQHGIVDVPEGLERVVLRCLEKERSLRYSNAQELATALARFGSADARISLTRVSGMYTSSASLPALTRAIVADPSGYEPTLDVSSGAGSRPPSGDRHATNDIQGKPSSRWARRGAAVALAAVLGAGGLYALRPQSPGGVSSGAAVQPTSSAQALEPPAIAPVSKPPAVAPLPTERVLVPLPPPSIASAASDAPRRRRAPRVAVASATLPAPSVVAAPEPTADVSKSRSPGRSEEIERLIQQRR